MGMKKASYSLSDEKGSRFSLSLFKGQFINLIRSAGIGTFMGILPGVGGSAASILAYSQAKSLSLIHISVI